MPSDANWIDERNRVGLQILASKERQRALLSQAEREMMERVVVNVEIPQAIRETIACNTQYAKDFYVGVGRTLHRLMNDPRTRPHVWSDAAIRERLDLMYAVIERIHGDGNATIMQTMARLFDSCVARMVRKDHLDDLAEAEACGAIVSEDTEGGISRMWEGQSPQTNVTMDWDTPDVRDGKNG